MNKAILCGNLGSDPEVRSTTNGKSVASFSIATSERFKDKQSGEVKSITDWHNVVLWGNLADVAGKFLKKGSKVLLEGKIKHRRYESNGQSKYITEIVADNFQMVGEKPAEVQSSVIAGSSDKSTDDLPF